MRETPREAFRWAPHTGGPAIVKSKDYEVSGEIHAVTPYAAWKTLASRQNPLHTGDVLEEVLPDGVAGALYIAKYVGFEPAIWFVPEQPRRENHTNSVTH